MPTTVRTRITAFGTNGVGGTYLNFRAVDPAITKLEVLVADRTNSITANLGMEPGQFSLPVYKFDTLQAFASQFATLTGVPSIVPEYDLANHRLSFRVNALGSAQSQAVSLQFDAGLGPLTYLKPATANFTVTPTFDGRIGSTWTSCPLC